VTDDQLRALSAILDTAHRYGQSLHPRTLVDLNMIVSRFITARTAYRQCHGDHTDSCNSYMGWGDKATCDCPRDKLVHALLGGGS
jgi:hypothetical protein